MKPLFKKGELEKIQQEITAELKPYLDTIINMEKKSASYKQFCKALDIHDQKFAHGSHIYDYIMKDFEEISKHGTKEEIHRLFSYLGLVESIGNTVTDIIVMILVANNIDFHVESIRSTPRIRHVNSIEDLDKNRVPLTAKLNFLRDNQISVFPSVVDSELRNKIAHMNFEIRRNQIWIKGKQGSEVVTLAWCRLITAIETVEELLRLIREPDEFFEK